MRVTLESTTKIVGLTMDTAETALEPICGVNHSVPARIWEGTTESGIKVHAYITRIAIDKDEPPEAVELFERELAAQRPPSPAVALIPLRLIL